jgi:hypothetical protein
MRVGGHVQIHLAQVCDCTTRVVRSSFVPARLYVSRSLQKADTRGTIVSHGCTSEAKFIIVRPWKLREQYVFSVVSFGPLVERGTSNPTHTRVVPLLNRNVTTIYRISGFRTQILLLLDFVQRMQGVSRLLTDPAFQSDNPRSRMDYVQSNGRCTTRARRQLSSKTFYDVAKRTGSRCGPVT